VAVICHATCTLLETRLSHGSLLVEAKTWTGFADSEEDYADEFVGQRIQPFRIEQEAKKLEGDQFHRRLALQIARRSRRPPDHGPAAVLGSRRSALAHRGPRSLNRGMV
jgi:hypothetical protein